MKKNLFFITLAVILMSGSLDAQQHNSFSVLEETKSQTTTTFSSQLIRHGHWPEGSTRAFAVHDSICLVGTGCAVDILNISNPANPIFLSRFTLIYPVFQLEVSNNRAYAACGSSHIWAIDITDVYHPEVLGYCMHSSINEFKLMDDYLISAGYLSMWVWDFSDPLNPVFVSAVQSDDWHYGIFVSEGYVYSATGLDGLSIFNLSDPHNPYLESKIDFECYSDDVWVDGHYAYCANNECGIRVIDVSDPSSPFEAAVIEGIHAKHVLAKDGFIHATTNGPTLNNYNYVLVDASDMQNPVICDFEFLGNLTPGVLSDNYLSYTSYTTTFKIYDVSNPYAIATLSVLDTPDQTVDIFARDTVAIVLEIFDGLWIVDITDPANPKSLNRIPVNDYSYAFCVENDLMFVGGKSGIHIFDIQILCEPESLGYYPTDGIVYDLKAKGNLVYLALGNKEACIIDASNPGAPFKVSSINTEDIPTGIDIQDHFMYITELGCFQVIDVSNPATPILVNTSYLQQDYSINNLDAYGDFLYLARDNSGVQIYNIQNPEMPVYVSATTSGNINSKFVLATHDTLYVANMGQGLSVLDVSDPASPVEIDHLLTGDQLFKVVKNDRKLYLPSSHAGFYIYSFDSITTRIPYMPPVDNDASMQIFPNPVTEASVVRFSLKDAGLINLSILDLYGNRLVTIADKYMDVGIHTLPLSQLLPDFSVLSSGVYVCNLSASGKQVSANKFVVSN